ncbi:MAG: protein-L-isoaspartate O-methyltransferase [Neisseria sp.]|nr:protein-L-isoaspartate O-methyltransferase [Neisseria sp.]
MDYIKARLNMVEQQIRPWDVLDFDVLDALGEIPREAFVAADQRDYAYTDAPLPLPNGGTMLEAKIVARLVQGLALKKTDKVLEIGTGSGYATALLARLAGEVVTLDTDGAQQKRAQTVLEGLNYNNIAYQTADGFATRNTAAPFDAVYVGGGIPFIPETLKEQLAPGGRLVAVVGGAPVQRAKLITRLSDTEFTEKTLFDTLIPCLHSPALHPASKFDF